MLVPASRPVPAALPRWDALRPNYEGLSGGRSRYSFDLDREDGIFLAGRRRQANGVGADRARVGVVAAVDCVAGGGSEIVLLGERPRVRAPGSGSAVHSVPIAISDDDGAVDLCSSDVERRRTACGISLAAGTYAIRVTKVQH